MQGRSTHGHQAVRSRVCVHTRSSVSRRDTLVNLDEVASIPLRFIVQLGHKLTPPDITDRFAQLAVLDHMLHLQTLDADRLIFTDQARRKFVQEITATISDTGMDTSHFPTSFLAVLRAFLLLGMTPLGTGELLLIFAEELRVANVLPIREDDKGLQAQVSTDCRSGLWQGRDVLFDQDGDVVAVCTILGDGDTAWLGSIRQGTRPHDSQRRLHLRKREGASIPLEGIGEIGSRLLGALLLEGGVLGTSLEEVQKCLIEMSQGLLHRNRRDFIEPGVVGVLLELRQGLREILVIQALLLVIEGVCLLAQSPIVDEATAAESASKNRLFLIRWVHAVLVGAFLFHVLQHSRYGINCQGGSLGGTCPPQAPSQERASYPQR